MSENTEGENTETPEDDPWADAMQEQSDSDVPTASGAAVTTTKESVVEEAISNNPPSDQPSTAELEPFAADGNLLAHSDVNMDVILDVPLTISMEIGRTKITIRNLLQLNQGSVVELDRMAGEHLDVMVNGTLVAHGEVVVANEKFGIRLTDVISPAERIKNLRP